MRKTKRRGENERETLYIIYSKYENKLSRREIKKIKAEEETWTLKKIKMRKTSDNGLANNVRNIVNKYKS